MSTLQRPFSDKKQQEYVQCAVNLDVRLSRDFKYEHYNYHDKMIWPKMVSLCSSSEGVLRLCQALITEMGRVNRKKMDVISSYMVWYLVKIKKNTDITLPPIESIASLVSLYMTQIAPQDYDSRIPNICLLLATMGNWYPQEQLEVLFSEQVISFFINCLYSSPDKLSQLYTLFTLVHCATYEPIKLIFFNNYSLRLAVKLKSSTLCHFNPLSLYLTHDHSDIMDFQIGTCAQWLMKNVYDADKVIDEDIPFWINDDHEIVNDDSDDSENDVDEDEEGDDDEDDDDSEDEDEDDDDDENEQANELNQPMNIQTSSNMRHLKRVFANNMSVFGCHFAWQDYQCTKPVNIASGRIFYFEAILLTAGSIRIGWATELDDFGFYGFSSDAASISFDAYEKKICTLGKEQFFPDLPSVNASDVVGCLLDTSRGTSSIYFSFYLNGVKVLHSEWGLEEIGLPKKRHRLYYPTVSLSGCQQVYFNFGQLPYRYSYFSYDLELLPVPLISSIAIPPEDIIANRMFVDVKQKKFEQWMLHFDWCIAEEAPNDVFKQLEDQLWIIVSQNEEGNERLAQAMIEQMAVIAENKIEDAVRWIEKFLVIGAVYAPKPELLEQLLQPYLSLQDTSMDPSKESVPEKVIVQSFRYSRNICIYLSILFALWSNENISEMNALVEQTMSFLLPLVIKNKHEQVVKLYALRALQSLAKSPLLKEELSTHAILQKHLQAMAMRTDVLAMKSVNLPEVNNNQRQEFDMGTLSKWLLNHIYVKDN